MKCQICNKERTVFFCNTQGGAHIVSCVNCAVTLGLKIIEKVKEVRDEGLEADSSRKRQDMSDLRDKGK